MAVPLIEDRLVPINAPPPLAVLIVASCVEVASPVTVAVNESGSLPPRALIALNTSSVVPVMELRLYRQRKGHN